MRFKNIIPQPFDSEKQFLRYHHLDLPDLDGFRLWQEEEIAKQRLAWVDPKSEEAAWLLRRLAAIDAERERRRRGVEFAQETAANYQTILVLVVRRI